MEDIYQKWHKVLELLFEYPKERFTVEKIAKRAKIPATTVQRYLQKMRNQKIITKENQLIATPYLKFLKANHLIKKLFSTGLIEYLEKTLAPSVIIVFGGVRKGEYDHESDIDLFIETHKEIKLNLKVYENKIGHKIDIFTEKDINNLPPNLHNNIINGIKLRGYFKIK